MMKKILITGSSVFLGSRLAYYLKDKYDLLLPSHGELNVSREEAVRNYMEEHHPDVVIHCAALSIYGQHKLECEQRTGWNLPESVGLRLTWMYDLPDSHMKLNSNILVNLQKAYNEGNIINAAIHEYRGVTNVWDVVRNIEKAISLPGGIYNFGSGNTLNSYDLHLKAANLLELKEPEKWIIPDDERFYDEPRNLTMDCSLINEFGIHFPNSTEGMEEAINRPFRTN